MKQKSRSMVVNIYCGAAIDSNTWEVLGVWITQGRCSLDAYSFLKQVLKKCENNPKILVDDGPW